MKITFKDCLERKRIFHFEPAKRLVDLELEDANNDYLSAKEELAKDGFKWATILWGSCGFQGLFSQGLVGARVAK